MAKRWRQVAFDAAVEVIGGTIIRITRGTKGDAMASVASLHWFEPDGHEHTGYASATESGRRKAADVIPEYKKLSASIALESDDLWDPSWGELMPIVAAKRW